MPSGFRRSYLRDFDADRLRDVLRGGRADHLLLDPGASDADILRLEADDLSVDRGRYGFGVLAAADFRPGFLAFGHARSPTGHTRVNGLEVRDRHLQVYPEGSEIHYRADAETTWTLIQLHRETVQRHAESRLGRSLELPERQLEILRMPAPAHAALLRVLDSVLADHEAGAPECADVATMQGLLIDALVDACAPRGDDEQRRRASHRRAEIVRAARCYLSAQDSARYDSAAVCGALGVTERTLQLHFRQLVGVSPRAWFRLDRLHRARALLRAGGARVGVADAALRCGFHQLGRFSVEYRRVFGERPSETVRAAAGAPPRAPGVAPASGLDPVLRQPGSVSAATQRA